MKKERSFLEKVKLFFFPTCILKKVFFKWYFVCILWWLNSIVHVLFLERFTSNLESWNKNYFIFLLYYYLLYIFLYEIINFLTKKWWWVEAIPQSWAIISKKYLKDFIKLDNNAIELEWTWKLISIVWWWIKQWWLSLWMIVEKLIRLILSVIFAFFMVTKVDIWYWLIFIFLFILFWFISNYINRKMWLYRKKRNENINIVYKNFAKIIMSKMEILQTNKINSEIQKIDNLYNIDEKINKDMSVNRTILTRNADFLMWIFFLVSYYFLWNSYFNQDISLSVIVWFWWSLILMQKSMSESLTTYIQFIKDFVVIEKLWDFFENTPQITGYEEWNIFKHKLWEIEIRNIYYWYDKNKYVFRDFSLKIKWWEITAFVW